MEKLTDSITLCSSTLVRLRFLLCLGAHWEIDAEISSFFVELPDVLESEAAESNSIVNAIGVGFLDSEFVSPLFRDSLTGDDGTASVEMEVLGGGLKEEGLGMEAEVTLFVGLGCGGTTVVCGSFCAFFFEMSEKENLQLKLITSTRTNLALKKWLLIPRSLFLATIAHVFY